MATPETEMGSEDEGLERRLAEVRGATDELGRAVAGLWLSEGLELVNRLSRPLAQGVGLLRTVAAGAARVPQGTTGDVARASAAVEEALACLRRAQDELLDAAGALRAASITDALPPQASITDEMLREVLG